ncbi:transposase [Paraburkholderia diazotrophica]|uniref:transposase n=1 Tax=Paraburkholderia diazotrophica TaxID=667676 RepID=UPI00317DC8D5
MFDGSGPLTFVSLEAFLESDMNVKFESVLTDEQWTRVSPIFEREPKIETRGRPGYRNRDVFECVLWVISNGAPWATLPTRAPDFRTCHRRFKMWSQQGLLDEVLPQLFGESAETLLQSIKTRSRSRQQKHSVLQHRQSLEAMRGT